MEPFGGPQEDLRAAYAACFIQQANRGKGQRALKPGDLFTTLKVETDQDDIAASFKEGLSALHGKKRG